MVKLERFSRKFPVITGEFTSCIARVLLTSTKMNEGSGGCVSQLDKDLYNEPSNMCDCEFVMFKDVQLLSFISLPLGFSHEKLEV